MDTRTYQREYAQRRRDAKRAQANADAMKCRARLSRNKICKTPLQNRFVDGVTVPWCQTCDRKARGVCIRCTTAPVVGQVRRALYCAPCKKLAYHESLDRYKQRNKGKLRRKERRRMADPVVRADRNEYKRLSRKAKPKKTAAYKKAYALRNADKVKAYMVEYRAKHAEERRKREWLRHRGLLPDRSCLTCDTIVTGRAKRCTPCKDRDRTNALAAIRQRPGMEPLNEKAA